MDAPSLLFDNRLADATPVASSTETGYSALNLIDWRNYTWFKPATLPATVRTACGSSKAADYCAVIGHDLATQGATLEVRGSTDNWVSSDVLIASHTPSTDDPFLLQFASVSYPYWGIRITGTTAPALAIVAVGEALQIPSYIAEGFDPTRREIKGTSVRSIGGNPLGNVVDYEEWRQSITFELVTETWLASSWIAAWKAHLRSSPCAFVWDPVSHPDDIKYIRLGEKYDTPHSAGGYVDLTVEMNGPWQ